MRDARGTHDTTGEPATAATRRPAAQRFAFVLGGTVRWTLWLVSFPYWSIASNLWRRGRRFASERATKRRAARLAASTASPDQSPAPPTTLADALAHPDSAVRRVAVETLGERSDAEAVGYIIEALHDVDASVRATAARSATRAGSPTAVFSLILALDDDDEDVRDAARAAIEALVGEAIDFDPHAEPTVRSDHVDALRRWWKHRRFEQLLTPVDDGVGP